MHEHTYPIKTNSQSANSNTEASIGLITKVRPLFNYFPPIRAPFTYPPIKQIYLTNLYFLIEYPLPQSSQVLFSSHPIFPSTVQCSLISLHEQLNLPLLSYPPYPYPTLYTQKKSSHAYVSIHLNSQNPFQKISLVT